MWGHSDLLLCASPNMHLWHYDSSPCPDQLTFGQGKGQGGLLKRSGGEKWRIWWFVMVSRGSKMKRHWKWREKHLSVTYCTHLAVEKNMWKKKRNMRKCKSWGGGRVQGVSPSTGGSSQTTQWDASPTCKPLLSSWTSSSTTATPYSSTSSSTTSSYQTTQRDTSPPIPSVLQPNIRQCFEQSSLQKLGWSKSTDHFWN